MAQNLFLTPQSGHSQSSGKSSNAVPGSIKSGITNSWIINVITSCTNIFLHFKIKIDLN